MQKLHPLSPAQRRIWAADAIASQPGSYCIPLSWRLVGKLDVGVLRRSLQLLAWRHDALRTRFRNGSGGVVQFIVELPEWPLTCVDFSHEQDKDDASTRLQKEEAVRPFCLDREPPVRATLARLDKDIHVLLLTLHHLVVDGCSIGVLLRDLARAFAGFVENCEPDLPSLALGYDQYAEGLPEPASCQMSQKEAEYWRNELAGGLEPLALAVSGSDKCRGIGPGDWVSLGGDALLSASVQQCAKSTQTTVFSIFAAAVATLLHRHTGRRDFCLSYPIANRHAKDHKDLVGCLITTLPLRCRLEPNDSFNDVARRIRQSVVDGRRHPSFLVDEIVLDGAAGDRAALSQIILNQNNNYQAPLELLGLQTESLPRVAETVFCELGWILMGISPLLHGRLEYNADL
ncbi:condensation domain-containing protein, partial [Chromobacterium vaccinii]|uniref:condensation domain-containing protein n=1 Tax=Chromobacterium vaccinii TaxID=1108595 RepID=UPI001E4F6F97|nr:condensation domain-containing protein [Chromobacterium vaccinii]